MELSKEEYRIFKEKAEDNYKKIGDIKCPYFNDDNIHFNTKGLNHLLFKSWNRARSQKEQYTRLRLIPLARKIIAKSNTLQEFDEREIFVKQKINSRWEKRLKIVRYYVFIAIFKKTRLKVVVKEIDGGDKFFYSLYPHWQIEIDGDGNEHKVFYTGDLEND